MSRPEWDPLKELAGVQDRMNKLFESALARTKFDTDGGVGAWLPVSDVYETPDRMVFCVELPGLVQAEIEVRVDGNELLVQGERRMDRESAGEFHRVERSYGKFARRFPLPPRVNPESVQALYRDGVLEVTLAKKDDDARSIRVAVR